MVAIPGGAEPAGKRVAVMQPYFFPYAGYFRLLNAVDHFVIFDCVQFPRRGRVHRAAVTGPDGEMEWLTLPLEKQPRDVLISELAFAPEARRLFDSRLARHAWLTQARGAEHERLRALLYGPLRTVVDFLEEELRLVADLLGFNPHFSRSSALCLSPDIKAQERVIAVVKAVGGAHYLNSPAGRGLYDPQHFAARDLTLSFLPHYRGPYTCILPALLTQPHSEIRADILASTAWEPPI